MKSDGTRRIVLIVGVVRDSCFDNNLLYVLIYSPDNCKMEWDIDLVISARCKEKEVFLLTDGSIMNLNWISWNNFRFVWVNKMVERVAILTHGCLHFHFVSGENFLGAENKNEQQSHA